MEITNNNKKKIEKENKTKIFSFIKNIFFKWKKTLSFGLFIFFLFCLFFLEKKGADYYSFKEGDITYHFFKKNFSTLRLEKPSFHSNWKTFEDVLCLDFNETEEEKKILEKIIKEIQLEKEKRNDKEINERKKFRPFSVEEKSFSEETEEIEISKIEIKVKDYVENKLHFRSLTFSLLNSKEEIIFFSVNDATDGFFPFLDNNLINSNNDKGIGIRIKSGEKTILLREGEDFIYFRQDREIIDLITLLKSKKNFFISSLQNFYFILKKISFEILKRFFWLVISLSFFYFILGYFFSNLNLPFSMEIEEEETKIESIGFDEISGLKEAKKELTNIIKLIKNSEESIKNGVKIPKGVILVGPPGNGKTMLAKALAKESELPFIYCSAAEFEDAFIGSGAGKIKKLFSVARSFEDGCIIFIDEFDSLAKKNYFVERRAEEQTKNQLLTELEGFRENKKILVIAATNVSIQDLEPAVIRSGRFDRYIEINNPDYSEREELISFFIKNRKKKEIIFDEEDLNEVFRDGMSSSQIVCVLSDAILTCIEKEKKIITLEDVYVSLEKNIFGIIKKETRINKEEEIMVAYHEAGHVVSALCSSELYVSYVTINSHSEVRGYTDISTRGTEKGEIISRNIQHFISDVTCSVSGMVSEIEKFGEEKASPNTDLIQANYLIQYMIDTNITNLNFFETIIENKKIVSQNMLEKIEKKKEEIINECFERSRRIIKKNYRFIEILVEELLEKKSLTRKQINYLFITKKRINLKKIGQTN